MIGAGTSVNPWQVTDYDDLKKVGRGYDAGDDETYALSDHYILTADIDASASQTENGSGDPVVYAGWTRINGTFTGVFDGDGYAIEDLFGRTNGSTYGLFERVDGTVRNLFLKDTDFGKTTAGSSHQYMGGVCGDFYGTIENVAVTGSLDMGSGWYVGGIAGRSRNGAEITNCWTDVAVSTNSDDHRNGGITGETVSGSLVDNCVAVGTVANAHSTGEGGGIAGASASNTVTNSFWDSDNVSYTRGGGTGKTTTQLQDIDTYTDTDTTGLTDEWDMVAKSLHDGDVETAVWFIDDGVDYPRLWFEYEATAAYNMAGGTRSGGTMGDMVGVHVEMLGNSVSGGHMPTDVDIPFDGILHDMTGGSRSGGPMGRLESVHVEMGGGSTSGGSMPLALDQTAYNMEGGSRSGGNMGILEGVHVAMDGGSKSGGSMPHEASSHIYDMGGGSISGGAFEIDAPHGYDMGGGSRSGGAMGYLWEAEYDMAGGSVSGGYMPANVDTELHVYDMAGGSRSGGAFTHDLTQDWLYDMTGGTVSGGATPWTARPEIFYDMGGGSLSGGSMRTRVRGAGRGMMGRVAMAIGHRRRR